jgi:hypothetical protein
MQSSIWYMNVKNVLIMHNDNYHWRVWSSIIVYWMRTQCSKWSQKEMLLWNTWNQVNDVLRETARMQRKILGSWKRYSDPKFPGFFRWILTTSYAFRQDPARSGGGNDRPGRENISGHRLLNDYQWLHHLQMLIRSNCHIVPDTLKYLRYTDYLMSAYNNSLMHVLLSVKLLGSVSTCLPIVTSFISG